MKISNNQKVINKWIPGHSGRDFHNAEITYSSWGEIDVEYKYKKNPEDANLWGYDPYKVFTAAIHFTSKAKAKQFIKELTIANLKDHTNDAKFKENLEKFKDFI